MNTEYVIAAIECLVDAKVNGTSQGVRQAQKELRKAFGEADLAPCAAKLKVDFEEAKMADASWLGGTVQTYRDDKNKCFTFSSLSSPEISLSVSFSDFESFVLGLVASGLANQAVSPSRLESLIDSRPWASFASSSASSVSVLQETAQRDSGIEVDFEEDLPKNRYVTFLYDKGDSHPTRRMIQVDKDIYGVISGIDVDKDEYRRFSKHKIIGNIEEIL